MTTNPLKTQIFFKNHLLHGYSKTHELKLITINLASPERIKAWAEKVLPNGKIFGEVTNANTLHYKTFKPQKGGLFCERIFGPLKDFECACGIRRRPSESESKKILEHKQTTHHFCPNCDVEYTWSVIRRYQLGYIRLSSPVCHLWYLKTNPSYLSILLDIKRRDLESMIYCTQIPTIEYFWKGFNSYSIETSPAQIYLSWKHSFEKKIEQKVSLFSIKNKIELETEKRQEFQMHRRIDWKKLMEHRIHDSTLFQLDNEATPFMFEKNNGKVEQQNPQFELVQKMHQHRVEFQQKQLLSFLIKELWKEFYSDLFIQALKRSSKLIKRVFEEMDALPDSKQKVFETPHSNIKSYKKSKKNPYIKDISNLLETRKKKLEFEMDQSFRLLMVSDDSSPPTSFEKNQFLSILNIKDFRSLYNKKNKKKMENLFFEFPSFVKVSSLLNDYYEIMIYSFLQENRNDKAQEFFDAFSNAPSPVNSQKEYSSKVFVALSKVMMFIHDLKQQGWFWKKDGFYSLLVEYLTIIMFQQQTKRFGQKHRSMVRHSKKNEAFFAKSFQRFPEKKASLKWKKGSISKTGLPVYEIASGLQKLEKWKKFLKQRKLYHNQKTETFKKNLFKTSTLSSSKKGSFSNNSNIPSQTKEFNRFSISIKPFENVPSLKSRNRFEISNFLLMSTKLSFFDRKQQKFEQQQHRYHGNSSLFKKSESKIKVTNNIYTIAYHYMWPVERDWKYFLHFNTAPLGFEDTKITYYKNRISYKFDWSSKTLMIGAGIVQQLLMEYEPYQLKEMAKQHQVLLPKLNNAVRYLRQHGSTKSDNLQIQKFLQKRDHIIRRLKLIRILFRKNSNPNTMILSILPVLPPDLRPILKLQGQIAASDLNRLYQRIIYRNDRVKKFLKDPATSQSFEMKYVQRLLQEAVDNLIQNGKGGVKPETNSRGQPLKSLSEILKGKQGRFRQYLLGKRVDYSGRSVIVVGPRLKLYECGLPKEMALELFLPFLIKRILHYKLARTVIGAKIILKSNASFTWNLLHEIMKNHPILLNRAPTLHRLGIQAFQPKLIEGRAILLHPLVCPAFNADFDGDQMAVHVPLTIESRTEAWKLMFSRNNLISPATGEPIVLPSQDMVLGCYYLTTEIHSKFLNSKSFVIQNRSLFNESYQDNKDNDFKAQKKTFSLYFSNFNQVMTAYQSKMIAVQTPIWVKWNNWTEFGNDISQPLEIRIDKHGNWEDVRLKYHSRFNKNGSQVNQYIRTTAGRVLMNLMIQRCLTETKTEFEKS